MKYMLLLAALTACTNEAASRRALEDSGFTSIQLDGWAGPFVCSDTDDFSTGFHATNAAGRQVSGVVCCGLWKACTVRF